MIQTNEQIESLIKEEFENPIVTRGNFQNEVVVKFKGSQEQCTFCFQQFDDDNPYCAEFFKGHNCLSFGYDYNNHNGGLGFMSVADEEDMSDEIIDFVSKWLKNSKRKEKSRYIQISLFDFVD